MYNSQLLWQLPYFTLNSLLSLKHSSIRHRGRLTRSAQERTIDEAQIDERLNAEDDKFRAWDGLLQVFECPNERIVATVALVYCHHNLLLHPLRFQDADMIKVAKNERPSWEIPSFCPTPLIFPILLPTIQRNALDTNDQVVPGAWWRCIRFTVTSSIGSSSSRFLGWSFQC